MVTNLPGKTRPFARTSFPASLFARCESRTSRPVVRWRGEQRQRADALQAERVYEHHHRPRKHPGASNCGAHRPARQSRTQSGKRAHSPIACRAGHGFSRAVGASRRLKPPSVRTAPSMDCVRRWSASRASRALASDGVAERCTQVGERKALAQKNLGPCPEPGVAPPLVRNNARNRQLFVLLGFLGSAKQGKDDRNFPPDFPVVGVHLMGFGVRRQGILIAALLKRQITLENVPFESFRLSLSGRVCHGRTVWNGGSASCATWRSR